MRTCKKCGYVGPDDDFMTKRVKNRQYKMNRCNECEKARNRARMATPKMRKKQSDAKIKRRIENSKRIYEYLLNHPCVDCGESDPLVLQFDHVRETKSYMISDGIHTYCWESLLLEIAKCDVRCANCHIRKTTLEREYVPYKMRISQ